MLCACATSARYELRQNGPGAQNIGVSAGSLSLSPDTPRYHSDELVGLSCFCLFAGWFSFGSVWVSSLFPFVSGSFPLVLFVLVVVVCCLVHLSADWPGAQARLVWCSSLPLCSRY